MTGAPTAEKSLQRRRWWAFVWCMLVIHMLRAHAGCIAGSIIEGGDIVAC